MAPTKGIDMTRVLINSQIRRQLGNLRDRLEFVDESGDVLGYYTPSHAQSEWECEPLVSDAELLRRAESADGRELKDILRDLESNR